jgi:putative ATP-dependent endonuclease of OLD family
MPRIETLHVRNYRSIGNTVSIDFPENQPLVLVGENNAGKSNIIQALDLVLGSRWPGNHDPDDHEFHLRERDRQMDIHVDFDSDDPFGSGYTRLFWSYNETTDGQPVTYRAAPSQKGYDADYVSNDARDECVCMVVEADRNLDYHLSYRSRYTLLSKLMRDFHKEMVGDDDVKERLEELFEEIRGEFERVTSFSNFSDTLSSQLGDLAGSMSHQLQVDFQAYNPTNFFRALQLQAVEEEDPRTLEELGTGEKQLLALSFAYAYADAFHGGLKLVIEEPEAHLHPMAQRWLAEQVNELCEEGLQVVLTTHSPNFINLLDLDGLVLVRKEDSATRTTQVSRQELLEYCRQTGAHAATEETILPFYAAQATSEILEGFFAKVVVLVEGDTEALALPEYLRRCGLNTDKEGIAIIEVGGKGNLAKWKRLFEVFEIPTYVVFDNDGSGDDADGTKRRDALQAVGIEADGRDELIHEEDWRVESEVSVFGDNFETAMRRFFNDYEELEEEAQEAGVSGKAFIARWVAKQIEYDPEERGWQCFEQMEEALRSLHPQDLNT